MTSILWRCVMMTVACAGFSMAGAESDDGKLQRDFWSADSIEWGDGRPFKTPVDKKGPYPQGFKAFFSIETPKTGWYEMIFKGCPKHDLLVDGEYVWHRRDGSPTKKKDEAKAGNLWLTAGKHNLCIQRVGFMGFPPQVFGTFELRPCDGRPEACVTADKTIVDVVRSGEKLVITVTGGGVPRDTHYEILSQSMLDKTPAPAVVGEFSFKASEKPETKTVQIDCPAEGVYNLGARVKGGNNLLPSEFPVGQYAVVDVKTIKPASGKLEAVRVIDCVAQTDNGEPLPEGSFVEGNGPSRVVTTKAGAYRESHDSTPPLAPVSDPPGSDQKCSSGFSYLVDLPEMDVPYLMDIEFPDDARRSVAIMGYGGYGGGGKGYETGGMHPFTNEMKHHRVVFWPKSKQIRISMFTTQYLCRAAAKKITISRFEDGLVPAAKVKARGGRQFALWDEEGGNMRHLVGMDKADIVSEFIKMDRFARFCRYFGCTAISQPAAGYQGAMFRTNHLDGFGIPDFDMARLQALFCEKYGMSFIPEVFPAQWYLNMVELPKRAEHPDDIRAFDCHGAARGNGANACDLNALHPVVQKLWLDALGELGDKLRDSPAFKGVTSRADQWLFRGDFNLPSLNWGYGDWTIRQFEKDTGIKVPGEANDPRRFAKRFDFLTAPERKSQWVKWRCDRLFAYHKNLRDCLRGKRSDIFFGVAGDFICEENYQLPKTLRQRALECGVDAARYETEDGLAVMPTGRYGSRAFSVEAQKTYDAFLDPNYIDVGMGMVRAFGFYFNYQEFGKGNPWKALGYGTDEKTAPYYCAACDASGRNGLEKYAVVLARQDSGYVRDGGDNDPFCDPEILNPWFAEYSALPMLPFEKVQSARDPVAVWSRKLEQAYQDFAPGFYFYAVNREQYPVVVDITLKNAPQITRLGTGEAITPAAGGALRLELLPYELRAFKTTANAEIASTATTVPNDKIEAAWYRLAFAQDLAMRLDGDLAKAFTADERAGFRTQLAAARQAMQDRHPWRVRTALSMAPALAIYKELAAVPVGQNHATFNNLLQEDPEGHWIPRKPVIQADKMTSSRNGGLVDSAVFNPAWSGSPTLRSKDGQLELSLDIPADGPYSLEIGMVATETGVTVAALDGRSLPAPLTTAEPKMPETFSFPLIDLKGGKSTIALRRDGEFGVYALRLSPILKPTTNKQWRVIGPFKTSYGHGDTVRSSKDEALYEDFANKFIPEDKVDLNGVYKNESGQELRWQAQSDTSVAALDDLVVGMTARTGSGAHDMNYGVTYINSETDRGALLCIGADWWVIAWLNGERLATDYKRKAEFDPDFSTWRHLRVATIKLKKGVNTLLLKQHGGMFGSGMATYVTDSPDITCANAPDGSEGERILPAKHAK